jgi:sigma-B regulation protein RsbU (phosphoserine phosphatase)
MASLRQLFDSLSNEQRRNQDLLVSLAFALRSFTNLHRFLELVPVVVSRLVGVDGALIVPFQSDGRLWRDQLQAVPVEQSQDLFRRLASFQPGESAGSTLSSEGGLIRYIRGGSRSMSRSFVRV